MSPLTRFAWWWLRWRGWAVQLNTEADCRGNNYERDGRIYNPGWRPLATVRYGMQPVYRVGPQRWTREMEARRQDALGRVYGCHTERTP